MRATMPIGYVGPVFGGMVYSWKENQSTLTRSVKLTDFGAASPTPFSSREDERTVALARRAQQGDYDEGMFDLSSLPSPKPPGC